MSTLGDLTVPKIDQSGPRKTGEFTYVDISSIDNRLKRIVEPKRLPASAAPSRAKQRLQPGDVLVSMTRPNLNAVAIVSPDLEGAVGSTGFHVLRAVEGIESRWLLYAVQTHAFVDAMASLVQGALYPAVRPKDIRAFGIEAPSLGEQRFIVAEIEKQFSRLDEAVANLKRVKANLKRYKASVLKAAVEGKFVSSDPSGWARTNLGAVLTTIEAGKSFKCEERLPNIREIGVVKVSAVTWGTYDEEESKTCLDPDRIETRYFVKPGDFLFSRANTIQLVGRCVIAQKVTRKVMLSDKILRFHFTDMVISHWVLYWLRSDIGRKEIQRLSTGNQESMRNIGQERIRQIALALPGLAEQHAIVAEVERRLSVIDELEATVLDNLIRADRLRQSILSNAFAGKLVCANISQSGERSADIQMAKSLE